MSYSEENLVKKFDALEETQDSIVSTSQWVLFYYRHADKIAVQWGKYLSDCTTHKILALVYLANDVVQQSRARKKQEFIDAFAPVLPQALEVAYGKVSSSTQKRLEKIVRVLNERRIFSPPLKVKGINGDDETAREPSSSSASGTLKGTNDEKIAVLSSMGSKFQRIYHELLLSANGSFDGAHLQSLEKMNEALAQNVPLLQELQSSVTRDIEKAQSRLKIQKEKTAEILKKQQELAEQRQKAEEERRLAEIKRLEELKRKQEEDAILPTYLADSDSDSESDDDKPKKKEVSDSDSELDIDLKLDDESKTNGSNGSAKSASPLLPKPATKGSPKESDGPRPKKKLRFAE